MPHQQVFSFQVNNCAYSRCSCGNSLLKIAGHSIGLGPQASRDLAEVMKKIETAAEINPSQPPAPSKERGTFQWAENKDLQAQVQKSCSN